MVASTVADGYFEVMYKGERVYMVCLDGSISIFYDGQWYYDVKETDFEVAYTIGFIREGGVVEYA